VIIRETFTCCAGDAIRDCASILASFFAEPFLGFSVSRNSLQLCLLLRLEDKLISFDFVGSGVVDIEDRADDFEDDTDTERDALDLVFLT